ncbi:Pvc16 family protein [Bradyrhizobium diazoefficiens]|uniref:Pvc16 family protein n=1 Tax=Bradyrhizobium diazoefficiens TaxID=1355477 RepID=UPI00272D21C9|nr:Pvc16 family protein [Bradyrhizobium diazoefficiens]WLA69185.1 Pvc16 family protein [Bradyrhizobium diazoefficiens]
MSRDAIYATTIALHDRIDAAIGPGKLYIGPPKDVGERKASLFLFNVVPNRDLRNVEHFRLPSGGTAPGEPARPVNALPVDLRYLISVARDSSSSSSPTAEPVELQTLGAIMLELHRDPVLQVNPANNDGQQTVRVTPEPYSIEELNRIWGMFPDDDYRTSVVYLASPVFLEDVPALGPPVLSRKLKQGILADPGDVPA